MQPCSLAKLKILKLDTDLSDLESVDDFFLAGCSSIVSVNLSSLTGVANVGEQLFLGCNFKQGGSISKKFKALMKSNRIVQNLKVVS